MKIRFFVVVFGMGAARLDYSCLLIARLNLLLSGVISHCSMSPSLRFNSSITAAGIVVLHVGAPFTGRVILDSSAFDFSMSCVCTCGICLFSTNMTGAILGDLCGWYIQARRAALQNYAPGSSSGFSGVDLAMACHAGSLWFISASQCRINPRPSIRSLISFDNTTRLVLS